jgi:putative holliday junction resolvase
MNGRILAVDPGEKHIGLAISDPTNTIANPLRVLSHVSRLVDAASIVQFCNDQGVVRIIVGQPLDWEGKVGPSARKSARLAEMIQSQTDIPVELWDESGTTREAQSARILMGVSRHKRKGHLDAIAATIILQSFLDRIDGNDMRVP